MNLARFDRMTELLDLEDLKIVRAKAFIALGVHQMCENGSLLMEKINEKIFALIKAIMHMHEGFFVRM